MAANSKRFNDELHLWTQSVYVFVISDGIQNFCMLQKSFERHRPETKKSVEIEKATISKRFLKCGDILALVYFILIVISFNSWSLIAWVWSTKNQPKCKQSPLLKRITWFFSIFTQLLYFTNVWLFSTWNTNQILLKVH